MAVIPVNALGDPCPIPVVKAKKAIAGMQSPGTVEVRVDNETAVQNLQKLAASSGLKAASQKLSDALYLVTIEVTGPAAIAAAEAAKTPACTVGSRGATVVAVTGDCMGSGDDTLGKTLMKGFLYALSQLDELPQTILFYNGGAKLTVEGAVSVEDLCGMEARGVEILTCGTCLNFYGLTDKLAVGSVTNMYTIVEKLANATKVLRP